MKALRKARLILHLLRGMATIALLFGRVSPARKQALTRDWTVKMLGLCGLRLVVHHDEARLDSRALVVGNHVSWLDIYVINAWRPTPFVSKAEVRQWPVVGWLAEKLGTVFLKREKRSEALRIMQELAQRLNGGELMCVFPEGTTSNGLDLLPFHANLLQAAVEAGCPVQPVCIMYEDGQGRQSLAPAYTGKMSLGRSLDRVLSDRPLVAHLYVGKPIEAGPDRRELSALARASVMAALTEMQAASGKPTAEALALLAQDELPPEGSEGADAAAEAQAATVVAAAPDAETAARRDA
ncbi:lysophospholipid acyltransferase family protein [Burkholderia sp. 22PA0099]|uniref:lysophospholipid acyltransferase family protein n=1 Tax=Burkholderia sp. 22PA0099 TaxID=3237372 RepID=UPI0039C123BD